mgnify:CR=1 FL=1
MPPKRKRVDETADERISSRSTTQSRSRPNGDDEKTDVELKPIVVLLTGPTGTGKTLLANMQAQDWLHDLREYNGVDAETKARLTSEEASIYEWNCKKWFDGYRDQNVVLCDNLIMNRSQMANILRATESSSSQHLVNRRLVTIQPKLFIFIAWTKPYEWNISKEDLKTFYRRVTFHLDFGMTSTDHTYICTRKCERIKVMPQNDQNDDRDD